MKKVILLLALLMLVVAPGANARKRAPEEAPIVTLKSSIFELGGAANQFHLVVGGREGAYIDVDCGYGTVEVELKPAVVENGGITGAFVTCSVTSAGTVKIYGDPEDIEYFEAEGAYLRSADISKLTNIWGLNLKHNELTGLDLTPHTKLQYIEVSDNPFSQASPLVIGAPKPDLVLLDVSLVTWMDPDFNLSAYPAMLSFDAFSNESLHKLDPTGCPELVRLTADVTPLEKLDVTKNSKLQILNIADTRVTGIDLSGCPELRQLFCNHDSYKYNMYKLASLDLSHNPELIYLFCAGNGLKQLDLSKNTKLFDLSAARNALTSIDLSANTELYNVNLSFNKMGFATLPVNPGTWSEYYYEQAPTEVNRSYKVGDVIDLSAQMLREGTTTTGVLMKKNEDDFSMPLPVDPALYKYENGRMTLLAAIPDSVFISYTNDRFDEATLTTTHFVVKTPEAFGEDNVAISFLPESAVGAPVSFIMRVAGPATPNGRLYVKGDFGDGEPVELPETIFSTNDGYIHINAKRTGTGNVRILLPEGVDVTSFVITNQRLTSLDLSGAPLLGELSVVNASLRELDLSKHRCLETLTLQGNNLSTFSLSAKNVNFAKTLLTKADLSNNNIIDFTFDGLEGLKQLDLSRNNLSAIDLTTATKAEKINLSYNQLAEISMLKCDELKDINLSHNKIASIMLPELGAPASMNIADNCMTLSNLPSPSLFTGTYTYAPQAKIQIAAKGPGVDLSAHYRQEGGYATAYKWLKSNGTELTEGVDYKCTNGVTSFLDSSVGRVYCVMSHEAFPQFNESAPYITSQILVMPMPTKVVAEFTTTKDGEQVRVALAATAKSSVFFDWKGDRSQLAMYDLTTSYTDFQAITTAGARVKVYAYDDAAPISVFSLTGASMADIDIANLTSASTINLGNAGLSDVKLPAPGALRELFLDGNNLTNGFDLSKHTEIYYLSLNDNQFEGEFDFSILPNLQIASVAANKLTAVKFKNPQMWGLDLARNQFDSINLVGIENMEQLGLSGNRLSRLDVSGLKNLKSLIIDRNRFTFSTLPPLSVAPILYVYKNQDAIDIIPEGFRVDLSAEATAQGQPTTYRWFLDEISQDEEGNYIGEELVADDEYKVEAGVTTFKSPFNRVVGLLTNPAFPSLALFTRMVDVTAVEEIAADGDNDAKVWADGSTIRVSATSESTVEVYNIAGSRLTSRRVEAGVSSVGDYATGVYIVVVNGRAVKVAVR